MLRSDWVQKVSQWNENYGRHSSIKFLAVRPQSSWISSAHRHYHCCHKVPRSTLLPLARPALIHHQWYSSMLLQQEIQMCRSSSFCRASANTDYQSVEVLGQHCWHCLSVDAYQIHVEVLHAHVHVSISESAIIQNGWQLMNQTFWFWQWQWGYGGRSSSGNRENARHKNGLENIWQQNWMPNFENNKWKTNSSSWIEWERYYITFVVIQKLHHHI